MAKAGSVRAAPRRSWFWLQGVVCGAAAAIVPGTALMVAVLLAPGLAVAFTEKTQGRPMARAMILMGMATVCAPLRDLWEQGGSLDAALGVMADPTKPLLSWIATGFGWFVGQLTEVATRLVLDARAAQTLRTLKQERDTLMAEWLDGAG